MKFEIYRDKGGKYRFRLKAGNGQNILASEAYESKAGAKNGVSSVMKNAPLDARYVKKESANGKFYFNLRAGNNQVIGTSEMYETAKSRDNGIEAVKKANASTPVVEVEA